jgi:hypothetical protein
MERTSSANAKTGDHRATRVPSDTGVVAHAVMDGPGAVRGELIAKATFRCTDGRAPALDADRPYPLFDQDQDTELGILPRDAAAPPDGAHEGGATRFEVVVLGAAYAPHGRPICARTVELAVGKERRELLVSGDRVWESRGGKREISSCVRFTRMPITYDRAFGGAAEVLVGHGETRRVAHPENPRGRGFDPTPGVAALLRGREPPRGYPMFDDTRPLPNVEDPRRLIARWSDAPPVAGWGALPGDVALKRAGSGRRAHPDWVIGLPRAESIVRCEGLTRDGTWTFALPKLRLFAEIMAPHAIEERAPELAPRMLLLLPEERSFYLVYRAPITVSRDLGDESALTLRAERGWFGPAEAPASRRRGASRAARRPGRP